MSRMDYNLHHLLHSEEEMDMDVELTGPAGVITATIVSQQELHNEQQELYHGHIRQLFAKQRRGNHYMKMITTTAGLLENPQGGHGHHLMVYPTT